MQKQYKESYEDAERHNKMEVGSMTDKIQWIFMHHYLYSFLRKHYLLEFSSENYKL